MASHHSERPEIQALSLARVALPSTGATLEGASVAGVETWIRIPEWSLGFDVGRAAPQLVSCRTLALTHAHMDHAGGLPNYLALRRMYHMPPARVLAPAEACDDLHALVRVWEKLHGRAFDWELVPMRAGDEYDLGGGRFLRAFDADHVVPTRGYAVISRSRQLRPELAQRSEFDIAALAEQGANVSQPVERVLLALTGDTRPTLLPSVPDLLRAEVLLHETTFLDSQREPADAVAKGHTHLALLVEQLANFTGTFVPYHISQIYPTWQARKKVLAGLPAELAARTLPFVP